LHHGGAEDHHDGIKHQQQFDAEWNVNTEWNVDSEQNLSNGSESLAAGSGTRKRRPDVNQSDYDNSRNHHNETTTWLIVELAQRARSMAEPFVFAFFTDRAVDSDSMKSKRLLWRDHYRGDGSG